MRGSDRPATELRSLDRLRPGVRGSEEPVHSQVNQRTVASGCEGFQVVEGIAGWADFAAVGRADRVSYVRDREKGWGGYGIRYAYSVGCCDGYGRREGDAGGCCGVWGAGNAGGICRGRRVADVGRSRIVLSAGRVGHSDLVRRSTGAGGRAVGSDPAAAVPTLPALPQMPGVTVEVVEATAAPTSAPGEVIGARVAPTGGPRLGASATSAALLPATATGAEPVLVSTTSMARLGVSATPARTATGMSQVCRRLPLLFRLQGMLLGRRLRLCPLLWGGYWGDGCA